MSRQTRDIPNVTRRNVCGSIARLQKITIRKVIREDHSAKTFNRPQWIAYYYGFKETARQVDFVLFIKWDRFSRNAGDAYQMINTLRKLSRAAGHRTAIGLIGPGK